jgi:MSHA biogenesis protein MshG
VTVFLYYGRDDAGSVVEGKLDRANENEVANYLFEKNISPIKISKVIASSKKENKKGKGKEKREKIDFFAPKGVSDEELIMFCRQMYTINKAGLPIIQGLNSLSKSIDSIVLRQVLDDLANRLESGASLAQAMKYHPKIFNKLFVGMVKIGESTGKLDQVFLQMSGYISRDVETRKAIKAALRYPSFVVGAMIVALFVVNLMVIPAFADMFSRFKEDLPLPTQILIGMSSFFVNYWWLLILIIAASVIGFQYWVKTDEGGVNWDRFRLKLPIAGPLISKAGVSRYIRSFSLMLSAGVPINHAVALCAEIIDNKFLSKKINGIKSHIERGDSVYRSHHKSEMFSPLVLQMINIGESSGKIDALLEQVADSYEREVDYDLKSLSAKIEPLLILVMAGFVCVLALGIFLPMWEMFAIQQ